MCAPPFDFHVFNRCLYILLVYRSGTLSPMYTKASNTNKLWWSKDFVKPQIGPTFHLLYVTSFDSQFDPRKYRLYCKSPSHKIRITVRAWKHFAFLSRKTLQPSSTHGMYPVTFLFICSCVWWLIKLQKFLYCCYLQILRNCSSAHNYFITKTNFCAATSFVILNDDVA